MCDVLHSNVWKNKIVTENWRQVDPEVNDLFPASSCIWPINTGYGHEWCHATKWNAPVLLTWVYGCTIHGPRMQRLAFTTPLRPTVHLWPTPHHGLLSHSIVLSHEALTSLLEHVKGCSLSLQSLGGMSRGLVHLCLKQNDPCPSAKQLANVSFEAVSNFWAGNLYRKCPQRQKP